MARRRFTVGTQYTYNKQVYIVREMLINLRVSVENLSFGGRVVMSQAELTDAWARGEIVFEVHGPQTQKLRDSPLATAYKIADFKRLPPRGRDEAWRRYQILLPILKLPPVERTRKFMDDYAASLTSISSAEVPPPGSKKNPRKEKTIGTATSRSSIEQWMYFFIESGYDIRSLVPAIDRLGGKGKHRLDADIEKIIESVLSECQAKPKHRTNKDVYLLVVNRVAEENRFRKPEDQLKLPGETTLYHRIQEKGNASILRRRASRLEMQAESPVSPGPKATRILERLEIDDTTLDLTIVDLDDRLPIGRPTLTLAFDGYSGWPCGVHVGFEPPSYESVQACLLHSILPKPDCQQIYGTKHAWPVYGLPEVLVVDNGRQYICSDLEDACGQLGIILEQMPVKKAWFKGRVERFFRTNNTGLIHGLPGTTFSNILERGDYDSSQHACISLTGFMELLHVFLLDVYAQEWHEGVGGGSGGVPAKLWEESMRNGYVPCFHHDADEMRILLYNSERRTVQRSGIDYEALRYQDSVLLAPLRDRMRKRKKARGTVNPEDQHEDEDDRAHVRVNPADLSVIYVYDDDPENPKWLTIPAVNQEYTKGLSLWKHRVIRNYVLRQKKEVNMYELAAAKQHIQEIVDREYELTRKGRKKLARYRGVNAKPHLTLVPKPSVSPPLETEQKPAKLTGKASGSEERNKTDAAISTETPASNGPKNKRGKGKSSVPSQTDTNTVPEQTTASKISSREGWGGDYDLP
jgi:putative transposase